MTRRTLALVALAVAAMVGRPPAAAGPAAVVTVKNPLDLARPSETIVLTAAAIKKAMPVEDLADGARHRRCDGQGSAGAAD